MTETARRREWRRAEWERDRACRYCGIEMGRFKYTTVDHAVPTSRGGADEPSNWVLCCSGCNQAKAGRTVEEWSDLLLAMALNAADVARLLTPRLRIFVG